MNARPIALLAVCVLGAPAAAQSLGNHKAVYDRHGFLLPWTSFRTAIERELKWYARCPVENGYPRFLTCTFMDGQYRRIERRKDMIPAMQNGMGILSYLKAYAWTGKKDRRLLDVARTMGDYLTREASTPDTGKYPLFPRSTGKAGALPPPTDLLVASCHPPTLRGAFTLWGFPPLRGVRSTHRRLSSLALLSSHRR